MAQRVDGRVVILLLRWPPPPLPTVSTVSVVFGPEIPSWFANPVLIRVVSIPESRSTNPITTWPESLTNGTAMVFNATLLAPGMLACACPTMCTLTLLGKFYGERFLGLPGWGDRWLSRPRVQKIMVALFTTINSTFHRSSALASLMPPLKTTKTDSLWLHKVPALINWCCKQGWTFCFRMLLSAYCAFPLLGFSVSLNMHSLVFMDPLWHALLMRDTFLLRYCLFIIALAYTQCFCSYLSPLC